MITIIIPTYNESENIPILLEKISENMVGEDYEVVVSRLARGVPVGGELEYMDSNTLSQAFSDRRTLQKR